MRFALALSTLIVGVVVLSCGLGVPCASAHITYLEVAGGLGPADASDNKVVDAACFRPQQVLGIGGEISGFGQVAFDDLTPSADLSAVSARGLEDESGFLTGSIDTWSITARALCGYPPAGLERVAAYGELNSIDKSLTATCPIGKRLLGLGANINGQGSGQVRFDDLTPNAALTGMTAKGVEDETGNPGLWSLTAYAICSNPVAGLERVSATSGLDSTDPKSATANCSPGKRVVGLGGELNAGVGQVNMAALRFRPELTGTSVTAYEDETGNSGPWSVTAYAICANHVQDVIAPTVEDSANSKRVTARCPSDQQVISAEGLTGSGSWLDDLTPSTNSVTTTAVEGDPGSTFNWQVVSVAICGTPPPGREQIESNSPLSSPPTATAVANCPAGKRVIGLGGNINAGAGKVMIDGLFPNSGLTSVTMQAAEHEDGNPDPWSVTAYAVCAFPPPGLQLIKSTGNLYHDRYHQQDASCPVGQRMLGLGGDINAGDGQAYISYMRSAYELITGYVVAGEDYPKGDILGPWALNAYAICANE